MAGNSAVFHPLTPLAVPLLESSPATTTDIPAPTRRGRSCRASVSATRWADILRHGAQAAGNDTQSRSEHPQDHPQSKPEHRNLGAERTATTRSFHLNNRNIDRRNDANTAEFTRTGQSPSFRRAVLRNLTET